MMHHNRKLRRRPLGDVSLLEGIDIPSLLKQLYVQRGISKSSELERSTHGLLNYNQLGNIEQAIDILVKALANQHKLVVVGDFDSDGATSTALMVLALRKFGAKNVDFLVPSRFEEGYGLSPIIVERVASLGAQLIVTVDNGMSSHTGVILAHEKNIQVLITDHHLPGKTLPNADAIVNPNLYSYASVLRSLSGVGVAFYLMLALRARLNDIGWFIQQEISFPKLATLLDLVALGTVVDLVPLDTNNRILVYQGLSRIRAGRCRPGIRALIEISNRNSRWLCAGDLGFSLGPRLNAAGRLSNMSIGITLLLTEDISQARRLAELLDSLNKSRRAVERRMEIEALALCQRIPRNQSEMPLGLVIYHERWHQGVIGILAARIKELFCRPVIAFAPSGVMGILKGSGRSIVGLHLREFLEKLDALHPKLILQFGGHAMAVGLTLEKSKLDYFQRSFSELISEWLDAACCESIIWSDGELNNQDLTLITAELLRDGGPWGQDFPDPLFDGRFQILSQQLVGGRHLKLLLKPLLKGGPVLDGIAFNIDLHLWPNDSINAIEVAYKLNVNEFFGNRSLQLLIEYIVPL